MSLRKFGNYDLDGMPPVLAWNPITMRCDPVDEGCGNCWHIRMCNRMAKNPKIAATARGSYAGGLPAIYEDAMFDCVIFPRKSRIIAVQFMGDLWHEKIKADWRYHIIQAIRCDPQHIFLCLTKRPERVTEELPDNCWLGTSVHDQASAEIRVPQLLKANAKHKWLSVEPMLRSVCIQRAYPEEYSHCERCGWHGFPDIEQTDEGPVLVCPKCGDDGDNGYIFESIRYGNRDTSLCGIDFVACGPETGNGARKFWMEDIAIGGLAGQCKDGKIPFYDKRDPSTPDFTRREWPAEWIGAV